MHRLLIVQTQDGVLELAVCAVRSTLWIDHYVTAVYVPPGASMLAVSDAGHSKALGQHVVESRYLPNQIPEKWRRALERNLDAWAMTKVRSAFKHSSTMTW